jgi:hypothetical protein
MNAQLMKIFIFLVAVALVSCQDQLGLTDTTVEGTQINSSFPAADETLWPFFQSFERAALDQGQVVDLVAENIKGSIMPIDEANVVGTCTYGGFSPGEIVVDQQFWSRANYYAKEMIVFHELGHCFLFRDHLEGRRPNGSCVSIMRSGLERCRDVYSATTKDYYVQELFSVNNRAF